MPKKIKGMTIRWTLNKSGLCLILDGDQGEYLKFDVRDTLVSLTTHLVMTQGYSINN